MDDHRGCSRTSAASPTVCGMCVCEHAAGRRNSRSACGFVDAIQMRRPQESPGPPCAAPRPCASGTRRLGRPQEHHRHARNRAARETTGPIRVQGDLARRRRLDACCRETEGRVTDRRWPPKAKDVRDADREADGRPGRDDGEPAAEADPHQADFCGPVASPRLGRQPGRAACSMVPVIAGVISNRE